MSRRFDGRGGGAARPGLVVPAALLVAAAALLGGCGDEEAPAGPPPSRPPGDAPPAAPAPRKGPTPRKPLTVQFTDLHEDRTGFGPVNHTGIPDDKRWIAEAMGGGVVLLDYDGDGDMDILAVDGNVVDRPPDPEARTRLYRNEGGLRFTDVTAAARIDIRDVGYGGAAADYDGDGDPDVYVCVLGRNHLLRNEGDGTFTDVAAEAGVQGPEGDMSTACCWADLDGDGWLDLYVANYLDMMSIIDGYKKEGKSGKDCDWRGFKVYCGPMGKRFAAAYQKDRLFLSLGPDPKTGKVAFRDATENLRDQLPRPSFQPVAADFDGDGDLDVYVATDTTPNFLWVNDGKGLFRDQGEIAGCAYGALVNAQAGMGVDVCDYDHDGRFDITVTNFAYDYNTVYRNRSYARKSGAGMVPAFDDVSYQVGTNQPTFLALCWAASFTDFDNDGDKDLLYSGGHVYGEIDHFAESGTTYRQTNILLENTGGTSPVFADVSKDAGPGFRVREVHRGGGAGDLDDDGDEDHVLAVLNGKAYVLRNDGGSANAWIRISLKGARPRDPAGAVVKVEAEGLLPQWDVALRGDSFLSSSDPRLLFGLGAAKKASKVAVTWPSGARSEFHDLDARAHWLLEEGVTAPRLLAK